MTWQLQKINENLKKNHTSPGQFKKGPLVHPVSVKKNVCVTDLRTSGNLICSSGHHPQCIKGEHTQLPGTNCWLENTYKQNSDNMSAAICICSLGSDN